MEPEVGNQESIEELKGRPHPRYSHRIGSVNVKEITIIPDQMFHPSKDRA